MKVARFDIEEKLRWLLPLDMHREDFDYPFNDPQSVKHLIESVGIPHKEIGVIRTNGESIGFHDAKGLIREALWNDIPLQDVVNKVAKWKKLWIRLYP